MQAMAEFPRFFRDRFCQALLGVVLSWPAAAWGQEVSAENKAAARELALEGIKLAQAGKCDEALAPLGRAQKLYPAPTIVTWVGKCQIETGHLVEGTETLNQVARQRLEADAPKAYVEAQQQARSLLSETKPKIAKLVVHVAGPHGLLRSGQEVQVLVDGSPVAPALVGAPRPTDPGTHLVEAQAKGHLPQSREVVLEEGEREELTLTLEEAPADPSGAATEPSEEKAAPVAREGSNERNQFVQPLGWGLVGGGAVLLAGGATFGLLALSSEKKLDCDDKVCPPEEEKTLKRGKTQATLSTVFFGVGGVALVSGVVLLVTGRPSSKAAGSLPQLQVGRVTIAPDVGFASVGLNGAF